MSPENPIPIGKGQIKRHEKEAERIYKISAELTALFRRTGSLLEKKEELLTEQLNKPVDKTDSALIALLDNDIIVLEGVQNDIIDRTAESVKNEATLQKKILEIEQRISEKGY